MPGTAALDPNGSYAVAEQRRPPDRIGDLFSDDPAGEQAVQKRAAQHIDGAARDSGLAERAGKKTTAMP
ncbi:DUF4230 domain-containing protein [Streptomyces flavotricini]|uniref:DUF4230 domain-containing protein n=1 Tax=Streptomyces flavotricini TaxID=66888 RepID=A0ABS8DZP9_9ACTN|nr:DUF4230 domain-containing protein [Streptomyces flavotricini]MCC0094362.1 DUF4230 domain-containing protein [Streptomyces flavotricini]